MTTLDLQVVPEGLRSQALRAFEKGDVGLFLLSAGNENAVMLVYDNVDALIERGLFEAAFVEAVVDTRTNNYHHYEEIRSMADEVDLDRIREIAPVPPGDEFTLYRGVAGEDRRELGISWTDQVEVAEKFARRLEPAGVSRPAVVTTTVPRAWVLFCYHEREESEYFIDWIPSDHPHEVRELEPAGEPTPEQVLVAKLAMTPVADLLGQE